MAANIANISDAPYDWRLTRRPERPWHHHFHQALINKLFLCTKPNPSTGEPAKVWQTFAQSLDAPGAATLDQAAASV